MRFEAEVVPGVHRVEDAYTNWYLLEDAGRLTVVDARTPAAWDYQRAAQEQIGPRGRSRLP